MGFSISWYAVREDKAQQLLDRLVLSPTGETEEIPESLISTARLDTGWRVVWYNEYECPFLRPEDLRVLSRDHDILMCLVEEHVMASSAELWSAGTRKWAIGHLGEDGPRGLSAEGDLPECFASIRRELEDAQRAAGGDAAGVDHIFDIPLKVAQALVGFKHDEVCPGLSEEQFVVLSRSAPKNGRFARFFGGGA
jgi:hypothetical protein